MLSYMLTHIIQIIRDIPSTYLNYSCNYSLRVIKLPTTPTNQFGSWFALVNPILSTANSFSMLFSHVSTTVYSYLYVVR